MKKWLSMFVALSLLLAFSLLAFAQAKPAVKEDGEKMMAECVMMMEASLAKMKEMHAKMQQGGKADIAQMRKLMRDVKTVSDDVEKMRKVMVTP